MPANIQKLNQSKDRLLSLIKMKGPSLPVHLARAVGLEVLFASAFLSELYSEGKVKMSNMKIGSSSLYFLPGQENLLENFVEHLNQREKEAFFLLKDLKLLDDEKQTPVVRVALRALKDFAVPIRIKIDNDAKIFWRYFSVPESEIESLLRNKSSPPPQSPPVAQVAELQPTKPMLQEITSQQIVPSTAPLATSTETIKKIQQNLEEIQKETAKVTLPSSSSSIDKKKKSKAPKVTESAFTRKLKEYLAAKDIELLSIIEEKKKELYAKIRIDTMFGKQEYYLAAKDKKKISEIDLALAYQNAQKERLPALILAPGDLDKKAQEHIKDWKNLLKFEKVKL